ncbi:hypothetical protein KP509_09G002500 [Ceratopteris richardii]|nr:hypothetical protein KP509_09G002500 [Ceratopteris richardii]
MVDKGTGRPRGFGFVLFTDEQSVEDAIAGLHNGELDGRIISVSKAQPKLTGGRDFGYDASYDNADARSGYSRGGSGGGVDGRSAGSDNCFRCGRPGHWARECPQGGDNGRPYGGGDGARFPPKYSGSGYSRGGRGGRGDRFGGQDRFGSGPPMSGSGYGGDDRYGGRRDNSGSARYGDNSYGSRGGRGGRGGFDRGSDRYGSGGPSRVDRGYRDRPTPYGGRSGGRSNYDNHY